jgi:hypothetical protein
VLSDGSSPSSKCTRVSNASIDVVGCDGEAGALSCWCCP